ncbi:MAG TPA: polyprenol monophosphomannose synthase [Baekduia sp.]|uniref:polyprenol monophosphomannose synthase n=1 Tax=Baekduia sp. TaxID=2600305 RepID=UPI002D78A6C4|nr:polyprenol monophosphomannose synthase [Baekduia sp.]HET6508484.1 polyprenol monophosphomannose synthase [Baekduia sp.]
MLTVPLRETVRRPLPSHEGLWIVVPTYNEVESLPPTLAGIAGALEAFAPDFRILVVDDGSPDGTGRLADAIAAADPRVAVLHRGAKSGLGDAYVAGFTAALAAGARRVVQMDADGSHDPAALPALLAAGGDGGADVVLGSRYVAGGSTPDWSLRRRALSRGGSAYARRVLRLGVRDLTGGFKAWRADALATVLREPPALQGYGFQIELTYRAARAGLAIAEVPITFRDRTAGESKLGAATIREALVGVPALRRRRRRRRPAIAASAPSATPASSAARATATTATATAS